MEAKGRGRGRGIGRGRGVAHLKEIQHQLPKPPKAYIEEKALLGSVPDQFSNQSHESETNVVSDLKQSTNDVVKKPSSNEEEKESIQSQLSDGNAMESVTDVDSTESAALVDEKAGTISPVKDKDSQELQVNPLEDTKQPVGGFDCRLVQSVFCKEFVPKESKKPENVENLDRISSSAADEQNSRLQSSLVEEKKQPYAGFDSRLVQGVSCTEFVPKGDANAAKKDNVVKANFQSAEEQTEDEFVIYLFKDTVYSLSISPGYFDNVMDNLMETMLMFISKTETMEAIACTIIEQAIYKQNFLYSAVRMIELFLDKLEIKSQSSVISFMRCFYPNVQKIYKELPFLMEDRGNPDSQPRALGIALLFADLLCNIKVAGELNKVFLKAVLESINQLKKDPTKEMVDTLMKILKLTGPTLDGNKTRGDGIPWVDQIFDELRDLSLGQTWLSHLENGPELRRRIFSIFKMHSRNWDDEPAVAAQVKTGASSTSSSLPNESASDTVDWSEYYDQEEGEEYDNDYEAFLRYSNQL